MPMNMTGMMPMAMPGMMAMGMVGMQQQPQQQPPQAPPPQPPQTPQAVMPTATVGVQQQAQQQPQPNPEPPQAPLPAPPIQLEGSPPPASPVRAVEAREERIEEADREAAPSSSAGGQEEPEQKSPPTCHLHMKPNLKCKFCQRAAQGQPNARPAQAAPKERVQERPTATVGPRENLIEDYTRRTFNCSPMLKDQVLQSRYFKTLLGTITTLDDLIEEIAKYADTLDVYNSGVMSPSCFICQVYRLFTLPYAEDLGELQALLDHTDCAEVRCAGFLYMRFVVSPMHLWEKLEEYLFDDMELRYVEAGKEVKTTIGNYVEGLLVKDKYFSTPLPRVPVKVRQTLDKELAPLPQFRKRMEANQTTFRSKRIHGLPVEVYVDGRWVCGTAKEFVGRVGVARKIRVQLDGTEAVVSVHLGKVVLREEEEEHDDSSESGSESGRGRKRRRSRSKRRKSPDWSRWKGDADTDLVGELRERAREEAVCGHGKFYAKRPQSVEQQLWQNNNPEMRVSLLGDFDQPRSQQQQRFDRDDTAGDEPEKKRSREEDEEHKRRMREIYEKYGTSSKAASGLSMTNLKEVDEPEVLRLG